jgi:hypothetical protein
MSVSARKASPAQSTSTTVTKTNLANITNTTAASQPTVARKIAWAKVPDPLLAPPQATTTTQPSISSISITCDPANSDNDQEDTNDTADSDLENELQTEEFPSLASISNTENSRSKSTNPTQPPKVLNFAQVVAQSQKPAATKRQPTKQASKLPLLLVDGESRLGPASSLIKNASLPNSERLGGHVWPAVGGARSTSQVVVGEQARLAPSPLISVPPVDCLLTTSSLSPFLSDPSQAVDSKPDSIRPPPPPPPPPPHEDRLNELPSPIGTEMSSNKPIGFERPHEKPMHVAACEATSASLFGDELVGLMDDPEMSGMLNSLVGGLLMSTSSLTSQFEVGKPDGFVEQPVAPIVSSSSCEYSE